MTIYTYKNTSPTNYVKKKLENQVSFNGVAREPVDILNPVVEVDLSSADKTIASIAEVGNYVQIPAFSRYYYITGVEYTTINLAILYLHVDVLMSHWDSISSSKAIAARTSDPTKVQVRIEDPMMPFSCDVKHVAYKIEKGENGAEFDKNAAGHNYIVTLAVPEPAS